MGSLADVPVAVDEGPSPVVPHGALLKSSSLRIDLRGTNACGTGTNRDGETPPHHAAPDKDTIRYRTDSGLAGTLRLGTPQTIHLNGVVIQTGSSSGPTQARRITLPLGIPQELPNLGSPSSSLLRTALNLLKNPRVQLSAAFTGLGGSLGLSIFAFGMAHGPAASVVYGAIGLAITASGTATGYFLGKRL